MAKTLTVPSVTGIDIELRIAGPGARSYAFVIDWHIRVLAAIAWFFVSALILYGTLEIADLGDEGGISLTFAVVVPSLLIYFLYHPVLELAMQGRTPGKRIAGVRLVTADGGVPGFGALLIRNVFRLIDSLPTGYCVGLVTTICTEHSVRIGDIAAGTLLVYDESPKRQALSRMSGEALGRIGIEQAEIARELLERWNELNTDVRGRLARQLLNRIGDEAAADTDDDLHERLETILRPADA